jgi:hypothetical protein
MKACSKAILVGLVPALLAAALYAGPALADKAAAESLINRWFRSLQAADSEALGAIIADKAEIVLEDMGVTQNRADFLASMDEWGDAIKGGSISQRLDDNATASGTTVTVLACYRFPSGEQLNREVFTVENGLIARSVQTKIADDCSAF